MKRTRAWSTAVPFLALVMMALPLGGCQPEKAEMVRPVQIAEGEIEPANWGKAYPIHYDLWKKTAEATPADKSRYRRG